VLISHLEKKQWEKIIVTPKEPRHILGRNCVKQPLFRAVRKKMKKRVFL